MEVAEERTPDWAECPRNPEWLAREIEDNPLAADMDRVDRHNAYMAVRHVVRKELAT
jgi:hypothetical protein